MTKKHPLAPGARLPYALGIGACLFGPDIARALGVEGRGVFGSPFLLSIAASVGLLLIAGRIHRRWLKEQGHTQPGVRRSLPPQLWIGIGVLAVGFWLPVLLDAGEIVAAVVWALTFMTVMALVVVAGLQEPKRKAADEAKHRAKWENPFD